MAEHFNGKKFDALACYKRRKYFEETGTAKFLGDPLLPVIQCA
jgi:hypothetical protein